MVSKEDRLNELTLKQLKQLAKENRIALYNRYKIGRPPISKKSDIVRFLRDEKVITVRKINKILREKKDDKKPPKRPQRKGLNAAQKERLLDKQDWKCDKCGGDLHKLHYDFHHKRPISEQGGNTIRNYRVLCLQCHRDQH